MGASRCVFRPRTSGHLALRAIGRPCRKVGSGAIPRRRTSRACVGKRRRRTRATKRENIGGLHGNDIYRTLDEIAVERRSKHARLGKSGGRSLMADAGNPASFDDRFSGARSVISMRSRCATTIRPRCVLDQLRARTSGIPPAKCRRMRARINVDCAHKLVTDHVQRTDSCQRPSRQGQSADL